MRRLGPGRSGSGQQPRSLDRLAFAAIGGDGPARSATHRRVNSVRPAARRSAVVAIDPRDGGILALASYPNFDPNDFTNGIKESTYARYLTDPLRPLYNRAIAAATPTGSTFKIGYGLRRHHLGRHRKKSSTVRFGRMELSRRYVPRYRVGRTRHDQFRPRARGFVGRLLLSTRLSARPRTRLRHWALAYGLGHTLGVDIPG